MYIFATNLWIYKSGKMKQKGKKSEEQADTKCIVRRILMAAAILAILYLIYTFVSDWDFIVESFNRGWNSYN